MTKLDTFEKPDWLWERSLRVRKEQLRLTAEDEQAIARVADLLKSDSSSILDKLLEHCGKSAAGASEPAAAGDLQRFWRQAYQSLLQGDFSPRHAVGLLDSKPAAAGVRSILCGYTFLLDAFREKLLAAGDADRLAIQAVTHGIIFDLSLLLDACIRDREVEISRQRDLLNSLEIERLVTKSLLENAPVAAARLDRDFVVLECNQEFLSTLGDYSRQDVIGQSLFELTPNLQPGPFEGVMESGLPHREIAAPIKLSPREMQFWDWACWPVNWQCGTNLGVIVLFVDATERVIAQRQREDFVAMLSHDLKTPLIAVNRTLELLLEHKIGPLNAEQLQLLSGMYQSNNALYQMVQNLLDVYLYHDGIKQLSIGSHDFCKLVEETIGELTPLTQEKQINVRVIVDRGLEPVICDGDEIRRVLLNLIGNAVKFTAKNGSVEVELTATAGNCDVRISDTGRGIADEDIRHLFTRGFTTKRRRYSSTGLGLFLCKRIVEAHKGEIGCESRLGEGSTFVFSTRLGEAGV